MTKRLGICAVLVLGVVACGGSGDDDAGGVALEDVAEQPTTTEEPTTTTERVTTTTEPALEDPEDVVGLEIAIAVADLIDAGFEVEETEVIDTEADDGEVTAVEERPDGSVLVTVARRPEIRFLEQLTPVQGSAGGPTFDISGTTYIHGAYFDAIFDDTEVVEYDLGRNFRRFTATLGLLDDVRSDTRTAVEIFLDGTLVQRADLVLGQPVAVDLDVTDVLRLRLVGTFLEGSSVRFGLGDGQLAGVPSEVPDLDE